MEQESRYWRQNLAVCLGGSFTTIVAMTLLLPFLPIYVEELGVSDHAAIAQWSGVAFGATFFAAALMAPVWGRLADRYGRKSMLIRASLGMTVAMSLMGTWKYGFPEDFVDLAAFFTRRAYPLLFRCLVQGDGMNFQRTLKGTVALSGVALHSGKTVHLNLVPAAPNHGISFVRDRFGAHLDFWSLQARCKHPIGHGFGPR